LKLDYSPLNQLTRLVARECFIMYECAHTIVIILMLLRYSHPYVFYVYVGWWAIFAVKGLWVLQDNINDCRPVCSTLDFPAIFSDSFLVI